MSLRRVLSIFVCSSLFLLSGCVTFYSPKGSQFVRKADFTRFGSYAIGEVTVSDYALFHGEETVKEATRAALREGIEALGYTPADESAADFTIAARWELVPSLMIRDKFNEPIKINTTPRGNPVPAKSYDLVIEFKDAEGLFLEYRSNLRLGPQAFSADRAAAIVEKAVLRFPERTFF